MSTRRVVIGAAGVVAALLVAGAVTGGLLKAPRHPAAPTTVVTLPAPSSQLAASDASLMGLTRLDGRPAPQLSLLDQDGREVALSSLEARPVVLTFLDARCRDLCPVVAEELVDAAHALGPRARDVAFVAVNVDAADASTAAVAGLTAAGGLGAIPHWYALTGTPAQLRAAWRAYGVAVDVDPQTGVVAATSVMDFIAPGGAMRYQATPFADERPDGTSWLPPATITQWGRGIAVYVESLR